VTTTQIKDYILGILFIPCFIVAVFLLWLLFSFIFSCCCCGRAGFLGGSRFVKKDERQCCTHVRNSRITFLISAALVVAFAALFSLEGIVNVESSLNTFNDSLQVCFCLYIFTILRFKFILLCFFGFHPSQEFHNFVDRGSLAANQITNQVNQAKVLRDQAITYLTEGQALCSSYVSPYIDILNNSTSLDNYTTDYSLTLADAFDSLDVNTSGVERILRDLIDNRVWIYYLVPIVVSSLILIFIIGTIAAWFEKSNNCFETLQTCFLLPLLFIFLTVSLTLAVVLGLFNVPLSDICSAVQKVDPIAKAFDNITNTKPGDLADKTVRYFLSVRFDL